MIILPYRTNIRLRQTPYANYALIAVNVFIFFLELQIHPTRGNLEFRPWAPAAIATANRQNKPVTIHRPAFFIPAILTANFYLALSSLKIQTLQWTTNTID